MHKSILVAAVLLICGLCGMEHASRGQATKESKSGEPVGAKEDHGVFTGDVKLVLYVRDVKRSVEFYRDSLGFTFHHYHNYTTGKRVKEWSCSEPPIYAEMSFAGRRFGLHLPMIAKDEKCVGAAKVYFRVKDLEAHHRRIKAWGAEPSPIQEKPWMRMFNVTDPAGHQIYFAFTEDAVHGNPWFGE